MTTDNTENLLETCIKVNKRIVNGYGAIASFVRKLAGLDQDQIEAIINDALRDSGYTRDECAQLNKAYQMNSRRHLENLVFGIKFETELGHGIFYVPESRNRKADKLNKLFKEWRKDVSAHEITVKLLTEIVKANKKANKTNDELFVIQDLLPDTVTAEELAKTA